AAMTRWSADPFDIQRKQTDRRIIRPYGDIVERFPSWPNHARATRHQHGLRMRAEFRELSRKAIVIRHIAGVVTCDELAGSHGAANDQRAREAGVLLVHYSHASIA